jgi:hypothetical protein
MAEISEDWNAAPKDGSVIYVKFSEGPPVKARWNVATRQWQALRKNGWWKSMQFDRGAVAPQWWRGSP